MKKGTDEKSAPFFCSYGSARRLVFDYRSHKVKRVAEKTDRQDNREPYQGEWEQEQGDWQSAGADSGKKQEGLKTPLFYSTFIFYSFLVVQFTSQPTFQAKESLSL